MAGDEGVGQMSHSRGKLHKARFCPWCGLDRIERDNYANPDHSKVEFVCLSCGACFRLMEGSRRLAAARIFAQERKFRQNASADEQRFRDLCKRKFREIRKEQMTLCREKVGQMMCEWLEGQATVAEKTIKQATREVPQGPQGES